MTKDLEIEIEKIVLCSLKQTFQQIKHKNQSLPPSSYNMFIYYKRVLTLPKKLHIESIHCMRSLHQDKSNVLICKARLIYNRTSLTFGFRQVQARHHN